MFFKFPQSSPATGVQPSKAADHLGSQEQSAHTVSDNQSNNNNNNSSQQVPLTTIRANGRETDAVSSNIVDRSKLAARYEGHTQACHMPRNGISAFIT